MVKAIWTRSHSATLCSMQSCSNNLKTVLFLSLHVYNLLYMKPKTHIIYAFMCLAKYVFIMHHKYIFSETLCDFIRQTAMQNLMMLTQTV